MMMGLPPPAFPIVVFAGLLLELELLLTGNVPGPPVG
jgi:hypothetical protein